MKSQTEATPPRPGTRRPARFTDMPVWLLLTLVAIGLPRTVLADLDIVEPESGLLYYVLALAPFAAWLAVAILRRTSRPIMDFTVLGAAYGLSLAAVHHLLWNADAGYGNRPPASAVEFAQNFGAGLQGIALHGYTVMIGMMIGIGSGLVAALVALAATVVRGTRRTARHREKPQAR